MIRAAVLAGLFLGLFGWYTYASAPNVTIGDAPELAAVGATLGIGHSPGYPLFSVLGRVGTALVPFGNAAYRMTLQSAFWSAATVALIALLVFLMTGSLLASVVAGLWIGLSTLWLMQATTTEVFGLNSLLAVVILGLALFVREKGPSMLLLASFLLGLGLGNNHTIILMLPALVYGAWPLIRSRPSLALYALFATGAGATIYAFIPLRAARVPLMDWEEPVRWERFWALVTRARYGTFQLAQGGRRPIAVEDWANALHYFATVIREVGGAFLAFFAGWRWANQSRSRLVILLIAVLFAGPLFLVLTQVQATFRTRILLDRFLYMPLAMVAAMIGVGLSGVLSRASIWGRVVVVSAVAVLLIGRLPGLGRHSERTDFVVRDLGRALLQSTPPNAWLFTDRADEAEFVLAYLQRVEGRRPDVRFVDCNAGVSRSIYGMDYYSIWGPPRLAIRTAKEWSILDSSAEPVLYATHDPGMIPIERAQNGVLFGAGAWGKRLPHPSWEQLLAFRPWRSTDGRLPAFDRGLHADFLEMVARDEWIRGDRASAQRHYAGVFAYVGRTPWRDEMERFLAGAQTR